jgi:hypothetical protein
VSADTPEFIGPDNYPQMLDVVEGTRMLKALRAPAVLARAGEAMQAAALPIRAAIQTYVAALAEARGDIARVTALAREISGLADIAGLPITGRICESLCRHMDEARGADPAIVALHADAIVCAARSEPQGNGAGEEVAARLAALVAIHRAGR